MATTTRVQIADRIGDILDTISGAIIPLKFRYVEAKPAQFPAVMLKYGGMESEMLDTITDLTTYVFDILVVFPNDESADSQEKWQAAYDAVMTALNDQDNQTLSGDAVSFRVDQDTRPASTDAFTTPVMVLAIRAVAKVVQSI